MVCTELQLGREGFLGGPWPKPRPRCLLLFPQDITTQTGIFYSLPIKVLVERTSPLDIFKLLEQDLGKRGRLLWTPSPGDCIWGMKTAETLLQIVSLPAPRPLSRHQDSGTSSARVRLELNLSNTFFLSAVAHSQKWISRECTRRS